MFIKQLSCWRTLHNLLRASEKELKPHKIEDVKMILNKEFYEYLTIAHRDQLVSDLLNDDKTNEPETKKKNKNKKNKRRNKKGKGGQELQIEKSETQESPRP